MDVILLERVGKLGGIGDRVAVKDGYARNYLVPQGKAIRATRGNIEFFETRKAEIEAQNATAREQAERLAAAVDQQFVTLIRQASEDGRLYGSVSARDIADAVNAGLKEKTEGVNRRQIQMNASIKALGVYPVALQLHGEVQTKVLVVVARSDSEADEARKLFLNPPESRDEKASSGDSKESKAGKKVEETTEESGEGDAAV